MERNCKCSKDKSTYISINFYILKYYDINVTFFKPKKKMIDK